MAARKTPPLAALGTVEDREAAGAGPPRARRQRFRGEGEPTDPARSNHSDPLYETPCARYGQAPGFSMP